MATKKSKVDSRIKEYTLKNGDKRYFFQVYAGIDATTKKQRTTTRRGFKSIKEADLSLRRLELEINDNGFNPVKIETFQHIYDLWRIGYKEKVQESTYAKTMAMFKNHILPAFGPIKISEITLLSCQLTLNQWSVSLKKSRTIMNYAGLVFKHAMKLELIDKNPTDLVETPVKKVLSTDRKVKNFYDKEELELFFKYVDSYYKDNKGISTFFRTLAFTGIRRGEALALTWKDIDWVKKTVLVNKTLTTGVNSRQIVQPPKSINSIRELVVDDMTLEILKNWKMSQKKIYLKLGFNTNKLSQLIFPNSHNEHLSLSRPQKWLNTLLEKYSLTKITLHGFRHTHCSLLFEAGASIKEVQDRLGHSDIQTTMNIYTHVTEKKKDETAQLFANYLNL